jgi:hypothetical protein
METIVKVKVPTFKTVIEIDGKDLVLSFRQMKRNERFKIQIDIKRAMELYKKEDKTESEIAFLEKLQKEASERAVELLESVQGDVSIGEQAVTLDAIRAGELPEWFYSILDEAFTELNKRLNNLKAEAEEKNVVLPQGLPNA